MNAKALKMTEVELQQYCDTLSELELKNFQLSLKDAEIKVWKQKLIFAILNINLCALIGGINILNYPVFFICLALGIGFNLYALRCFNFMKHEQLMHGMMKEWFKQNRIM